MYKKNSSYKRYDKIYYIANDKYKSDLASLNELFKNHSSLIKDITTFEMEKEDKKTTFINIELKTFDTKEDIFMKIAEKIVCKLNRNFKIFMKTSNNNKYIYEVKPDDVDDISNDLNDFLNI
jgi:hypothetical protein